MNRSRPVIDPYEERAIDAVVNVLNNAKFKAGLRLNLLQLGEDKKKYQMKLELTMRSRDEFASKTKVSLHMLNSPLVKTCEKFIAETIERKWKLTEAFKFILRYMGSSTDESAHFLYYEAVFSQPTVAYPIPQATVSVYFRVEDKHLEPADIKGVPQMTFRIDGQCTDHDVRYVLLTVDWILAVIKMKINFFKRIEAFKLF